MSSLADNMVMMRILKMLVTPFEKSDAFKLGIIDKDGNKIKSPSTSDEKDAYNYLTKFVFNLKKLFAKRMGKDDNKLSHMMFLVKESNILNEDDECLLDEAYIESLMILIEDANIIDEDYSQYLPEEAAAPTNTTAIVDGHRQPPMAVGETGIVTRGGKDYKHAIKSMYGKKKRKEQ